MQSPIQTYLQTLHDELAGLRDGQDRRAGLRGAPYVHQADRYDDGPAGWR
jgi:hypothetical protein